MIYLAEEQTNIFVGGFPTQLPAPKSTVQLPEVTLFPGNYIEIGVDNGSFSYTGQTCASGVSLVDPVPILLSGSEISTDPTLLGDLTVGNLVQGAATDGVAQILLRILANEVGQTFLLAVDPTLCPTLSS